MPPPNLRKFGEFLYTRRKEAAKINPKLDLQRDAADLISEILKEKRKGKLNHTDSENLCSRASLSNYEAGISEPSPETLQVMSELYNVSRIELLHELFLSQHERLLHQEDKEQSELFWKYVEAGVKNLSRNGDRDGLHQLRALSTFAEKHHLLDRAGQLAWQAGLLTASPKLECFWVAHLDFLDNGEFYEVASNNIAGGAMYVYFIRQRHMDKEFREYQSRLKKDLGAKAASRVVAVPFQESEHIVTLNFVVANPHLEDKAVGFCKIHPGFGYNIKLPTEVLKGRINELIKYVEGRKEGHFFKEELFPPKAPIIDLSKKRR